MIYACWLEGQRAANSGFDQNDNPYDPGTLPHQSWAQGLKDYIDEMNTDLYPRVHRGRQGWP